MVADVNNIVIENGYFNSHYGEKILEMLEKIAEDQDNVFRITDHVYHKLDCNLQYNDRLKIEDNELDDELHYPVFDEDVEICLIEDHLEAIQSLMEMRISTKHKIFIDSESFKDYGQTAPLHGEKVALLQFFDPALSKVFLVRVHKSNRGQLQEIRETIRQISEKRKFVAFGNEPQFGVEVKNIQRNIEVGKVKQPERLKTAAKEIGVEIYKTETMSDWCRETLRRDQVLYAAMDAYVLFLLYQQRKLAENSRNIGTDKKE
uniref:3'-5' exonuclease domain-containing protein n=1 Tax=Caenorhabditis tropicalis TaxID=1561998 RepID=A0A1I7T8W9_9PELO